MIPCLLHFNTYIYTITINTMKWIVFLFSISLPCIAVAQDLQGSPALTYLQDFLDPASSVMTYRSGETGLKTIGSPLVFEDFVPCVVYFTDNRKTGTEKVNYNCHANTVLYTDGSDVFHIESKLIDRLEFQPSENTVCVFRQVFLNDQKKNLFLQTLYEGCGILYKRHYRKFVEADYGGAFSAEKYYDEYKELQDYYISLNENNAVPLKLTKKNLLNIMQPHAREIQAFLKTEKINLKSETDLVKVCQYYDSLFTPSQ